MPSTPWTLEQQDRFLADTMERDEPRLRKFIRRRVLNDSDAEDVLQDVFYELTNTYRLMKPIEQVTAWMYRVASNRITDLFRKKPTISLHERVGDAESSASLEDLLPSPEAGPEALYARGLLMEAMEEALAELPENQREVFLAHEFEGRSFKELSEETGVAVNTLLSRKRYAVLHLRKRLEDLKDSVGS